MSYRKRLPPAEVKRLLGLTSAWTSPPMERRPEQRPAHPPCPACPHAPYRAYHLRPRPGNPKQEPVSDDEVAAWVAGHSFVRSALTLKIQRALAYLQRFKPRR